MARRRCRSMCSTSPIPLIDDEIAAFCRRQDAVLMVEEGAARLHRARSQHDPAPPRHPDQDLAARTCCRWAANTPPPVADQGRQELPRAARARICSATHRRRPMPRRCSPIRRSRRWPKRAAAAARLLHRLPGAADLRRDEAGRAGTRPASRRRRTSAAICSRSCRRSTSARTTMGYGLGPASASAFNVKADKRSISVMGDGGFWHNGLVHLRSATPCSTSTTA